LSAPAANLAPLRDCIFGHPSIDCDVHPPAPAIGDLIPYFSDPYWREMVTLRGIDRLKLNPTSFPANAPINCRPDWAIQATEPAAQVAQMQAQLLDPFRTSIAICNSLHGGQLLHAEDMAAAFCNALNSWMATEWLDRDPRLRASILIPVENPQMAIEEIERRADDLRFVSIQTFAMGEKLLGRRHYWPIYEVAQRLGLPIAVHAGSGFRFAPTSIGWPSYFIEDYAANAPAFENQLLSLVAEGVFAKFPDLKVVFLESGWSWLPAFMWRANKTWRGVRAEVPWVKRPPAEIMRQHVRIAVQPVDAPPKIDMLEDIVQQIGEDGMLLFSTDWPHWHFDGTDALPGPLAGDRARKVLFENALDTYPRILRSLGQV
jgi:predicted TIM-barrel fold metal-dependent hydrolase